MNKKQEVFISGGLVCVLNLEFQTQDPQPRLKRWCVCVCVCCGKQKKGSNGAGREFILKASPVIDL